MTHWSVDGLGSRLDGFELGPVHLELAPGQVVAVLGRSGAGKTTLLRTIAGFLPVRTGRILREGIDVTDWVPERRRLGYVPQGLGLFPHRTVERNVSYALEVRGRIDALARSRRLLERFGLTPLGRRYPARLSGGELERVALARALAAEPELVLWDEPWQALDVEARDQLSFVFEDLRSVERVPVVVVTHEPALAFSIADSFLVLTEGRTVFRGDPMSLLEQPVDPFTARFAGFDNVFDRRSLEGGAPGSLSRWLMERTGPGGVAFPRPTLSGDAPRSGSWEGVVRSTRPAPDGLVLMVSVGPLSITVRLEPPLDPPFPAAGSGIRFDVDEKSVRALGARGPTAVGP